MDKHYAIFDMDGTLVDSMGCWRKLLLEYAASRGVPDIPPDIRERVKPMPIRQSSALLIETFGLPDTPEEAAVAMNAIMERHYRQDVRLKPGAAEYLRALSRRGVKMCVASATAEPLIRGCLTRLGILDCFGFLLSCEAVGRGKDRPDVYFKSAERLGARPADIAVYEDSLIAGRTARGAGFYLVGVYDSFSDRTWPELSAIADETVLAWGGAG